MPRQSRERRQAFARYNSSREPMVVPHGLSVRLGCRANQEHLLVLAVQTLSGKTRQEKSHHRGGAYPHRHWLSLAEEPEQLPGSWRKLLRSYPLRRSQAVFGEAAPTTRAQGNSRADGSCLNPPLPAVVFEGECRSPAGCDKLPNYRRARGARRNIWIVGEASVPAGQVVLNGKVNCDTTLDRNSAYEKGFEMHVHHRRS